MLAAARPYVTAGVVLVGSSLIAVTPMKPPPPDIPVEHLATRLLADSIANIPLNLIDDIANVPASELDALAEEAYAVGPSDTTGGGAAAAAGGPGSSLFPETIDGGTGSWYEESIGNTWSWDNGNQPQAYGLLGLLIPIPALSIPLAQQLGVIGEAELPLNTACQFECSNLLQTLTGTFFQVPLTKLLAGFTIPDSATTTDFPGIPNTPATTFGGTTVTLQPLAPITSLINSLEGTPTGIQIPTLSQAVTTLTALTTNISTDFDPLITGSFLYWGASSLYGLPTLLTGLVGLPNPFPDPVDTQPNPDTAGPSAVLPGLVSSFSTLLGYPLRLLSTALPKDTSQAKTMAPPVDQTLDTPSTPVQSTNTTPKSSTDSTPAKSTDSTPAKSTTVTTSTSTKPGRVKSGSNGIGSSISKAVSKVMGGGAQTGKHRK
jgi:hypothetical protein